MNLWSLTLVQKTSHAGKKYIGGERSMISRCRHATSTLQALKKRTFNWIQLKNNTNSAIKHSLNVEVVPCFEDNYGYVITDYLTKKMVLIDPADHEQIIPRVRTLQKV